MLFYLTINGKTWVRHTNIDIDKVYMAMQINCEPEETITFITA